MRREQTDFMKLLFSPEQLAQQAAVSEAMRAEAIRASISGIQAMANFQAFVRSNLVTSPHDVIESFARHWKPLLDAAAKDYCQQSIAGRFFAEQKLNWKPDPALRSMIHQLVRQLRSQAQPQELDTIA